jgi:hypothetical protein
MSKRYFGIPAKLIYVLLNILCPPHAMFPACLILNYYNSDTFSPRSFSHLRPNIQPSFPKPETIFSSQCGRTFSYWRQEHVTLEFCEFLFLYSSLGVHSGRSNPPPAQKPLVPWTRDWVDPRAGWTFWIRENLKPFQERITLLMYKERHKLCIGLFSRILCFMILSQNEKKKEVINAVIPTLDFVPTAVFEDTFLL